MYLHMKLMHDLCNDTISVPTSTLMSPQLSYISNLIDGEQLVRFKTTSVPKSSLSLFL